MRGIHPINYDLDCSKAIKNHKARYYQFNLDEDFRF